MTALKLDLIDLNVHPDAKLLRACVQATKLRDRFEADGVEPFRDPAPPGARELWRLTRLITETEAKTHVGLQMKAIFTVGDRPDPMQHTVGTAPFVSVIRDFLRMGVPTT